MFLASQLEEVERRYPTYVAELRGFFTNRGVPLNAVGSLTNLAERLDGDRGFHRGVSTLLEAMMYREQKQMSPADLLAMLMVAAQGAVERPPSVVQDQATQALLAFVLRLRESMMHADAAPSGAHVASVATVAIAQERSGERDVAPVPLEVSADPHESWLRRNALPVGSALVLLLGLGGYGVWYGLQKPASSAVAVVTHTEQEMPADVPQSQVETVAPSVGTGLPHSARKEKSRPRKVDSSPVVARSAPPERSQTMGMTPMQSVIPASESAKTATQLQQPAGNQTASAAPVRRRLPMPASRPRRVPGLGTDASATVPLEWMAPKAAPAEPRVSTPTVTPTALGVMASNLMYSPAPVYPAAANAAHVEGQVKVEATVGNDGSVTSARVVSGPELLRDAALGAVQHWHYRPYVEGGKARTVTTTALLDFQLP